MHNWNERDLLLWTERAGFSDIEWESAYLVAPAEPVTDYESRARRASNPLVPSLAEAIEQALSACEAERFVAWLRPRMEAGEGVQRSAHGYLTARKAP